MTDFTRSLLVVVLAAVVPFLPAVDGEYVVDDVRFVSKNRSLEDPSLPIRAFTDPSTVSGNETGADWHGIYRPLRTLEFALDRALGGGATWVFHVHGILWHIAAAILVLVLLRRLLGGTWLPLVGATIFALHPAQVESVAWITSRGDVMAGALTLAALLLALRKSRRSLMAALVLFVPALLAKESAVVLPILLVLILGQRSEAGRGRALLRALPFVAVVVVYVVVRGAILAAAGDPGLGHRTTWWGGSWFGAWLTMARGLAHYAQILLMPTNLMLDYHVPQPGAGDVPVDAVLLLVAGVALAGAAARSWWRGGLFGLGILWILVALAPVSNVILTINIPTADRFLYLPMAGFALLAAGVVGRLRASPVVVVALVVLLGAISFDRALDWRSESEIWEPTLRDPASGRSLGTPTSLQAPYHFAYRAFEAGKDAIESDGDIVAAAGFFETAERLAQQADRAARTYAAYTDERPFSRGAYLRCQVALRLCDDCGRGDWGRVLELAEAARLAAGTGYAPGLSVGGAVCARLGLLENAMARFRAAAAIAPDESAHRRNLVIVLNRLALARIREGRREGIVRALDALALSLATDPDPISNADAHTIVRALDGDRVRDLEAATRQAGERGEAPEWSLAVARVLARHGRFDEAREILDRLARAESDSADLLVERTVLLRQMRGNRSDLEQARDVYLSLKTIGRLPPSGFRELARCSERLAWMALGEGRAIDAAELAGQGLDAVVRSEKSPGLEGFSLQGALFLRLAEASRLLGHSGPSLRAYKASSRALSRALAEVKAPSPERARLLRLRAEALEAVGKRTEARAHLQAVLEILPDPPADARWLEYRIRRLAED